MIKEALKYVTELKEKASEIITKEVNGETYIKGEAERILPDYASEMIFNSLSALVDYTKDCLKNDDIKKPYIINVKHSDLLMHSGLDKYMNRTKLSYVEPLLPHIDFNRYLDMEEFVIQLKTCFVETDNLNNLVSVVSQITEEAKVEFKDDGFGMQISQTSGVAVKQDASFELNPIVNLQPYRTFSEIEQPASRFLIRVKDGGRMALFEADGGMWKLNAQKNSSNFLREALKEEINDGYVVVVG